MRPIHLLRIAEHSDSLAIPAEVNEVDISADLVGLVRRFPCNHSRCVYTTQKYNCLRYSKKYCLHAPWCRVRSAKGYF